MAVDTNMRVLIVDDYKTMLRIMRNLLKQLSFENVEEAIDGTAALEKLREFDGDFGLVISDWNMEPMTGIQLLREVRGDDGLKQIPFIMVTAESKSENVIAAKEAGVAILLPVDNVAADAFSNDANFKIVGEDIDDGWMALDIGPVATKAYADAIATAKTVVWNGPMGCFEMSNYAAGTTGVCQAVADADCVSIIGGGDSVSAVNKSGLAPKMSHISTGGGASLELLEGKALPGVVALDDK